MCHCQRFRMESDRVHRLHSPELRRRLVGGFFHHEPSPNVRDDLSHPAGSNRSFERTGADEVRVTLDPAARQVKLASNFTVGDYLDAVDVRNREVIADAIHRRFVERYLQPASDSVGPGRGFTMMAIGCLMIEALESFRRGWTDTRKPGRGQEAFRSFFAAHDAFGPFRGHARDFYEGVRCGILHQAETTLGWRSRRDGPLLDVSGGVRTINARRFVQALGRTLDGYRDRLKAAAWEDEVWIFLRKKMKRVCRNCAAKIPPVV